jgi:hypothetical protein
MWRTLLVVSTFGAISYPIVALADTLDPAPSPDTPARAQDTPVEEPPSKPPLPPPTEVRAMSATLDGLMEVRGVAQNFLVMPSGVDLGADLKLITADSLAGMPLGFSDLALFTLRGRAALGGRVDVSADATFLPKQPSYTDEKVWQSVSGAFHLALGDNHALVGSVGGGHLLDHTGAWIDSSLTLERRKPLTEYMSFDLRGGFELIELTSAMSTAHVGEISFQAATHFHDPTGHAGAWLGVAYAVPVTSGGIDPTDNLAVDPQPRLDLHIGVVLVPVAEWDVYIDGAVVGRGDAANPATRLPILDGGFSQRQVTLGVVRHFKKHHHRHDDDLDDAMILGSR